MIRPLDLSDLLEPVSLAVFFDEYFGKRALSIPGAAGKFDALFSGLTTGESIERLDEIHPPVTTLARRLERTLEAPIRARLSTSAGHGVASQDTFILCGSGQCWWKIDGAEEILKDGDALYIPKGVAYEAGTSEQTLLIEIAIGNPTGASLLRWLSEVLEPQDVFQKDIPRFASLAERAEYITQFRRAIVRACRAPNLLEVHGQYWNRVATPRKMDGAAWDGRVDDRWISMAAPRKLRVLRLNPETIYVTHNGKHLAFPEEAAQLLHYLQDNDPVSVWDFYSVFQNEFDSEELSEFIGILAKDQVIAIH